MVYECHDGNCETVRAKEMDLWIRVRRPNFKGLLGTPCQDDKTFKGSINTIRGIACIYICTGDFKDGFKTLDRGY